VQTEFKRELVERALFLKRTPIQITLLQLLPSLGPADTQNRVFRVPPNNFFIKSLDGIKSRLKDS